MRFFFVFVGLLSQIAFGQLKAQTWQFRIWFVDKPAWKELSSPTQLLSSKALMRRSHAGIGLDKTDFPVDKNYLNQLRRLGVQIDVTSRWMNTAVVTACDSSMVDCLRKLPSVRKVEWVGKREDQISPLSYAQPQPLQADHFEDAHYGASTEQIHFLAGEVLHAAGYWGEGKTIAVIDGGFSQAEKIPSYSPGTIVGFRDFVSPAATHLPKYDHGSYVYATMATYVPGTYVGAAPAANYWLLNSEITAIEQPVEEDYWTAALEYADSVGVDIVVSSLGYSRFEIPARFHNPRQLDGRSTFISRAAAMGAAKGMLLVVSAGNEGETSWGYITFPSDVPDLLAVAAVDREGKPASFSGKGYAYGSPRVKPDLAALGVETIVYTEQGIRRLDGTSFAAPVVAGLSAALWQALPAYTAQEIAALLRQTASGSHHPENRRGYGVPNFREALYWAQQSALKTSKWKP